MKMTAWPKEDPILAHDTYFSDVIPVSMEYAIDLAADEAAESLDIPSEFEWPVTFIVQAEDGRQWSVEVEIDYEPTFTPGFHVPVTNPVPHDSEPDPQTGDHLDGKCESCNEQIRDGQFILRYGDDVVVHADEVDCKPTVTAAKLLEIMKKGAH